MTESQETDGHYRDYAAGDLIFSIEDPGEELFLITAGEVEIFLPQQDDTAERSIAVLGEDDFFGEMALLEGRPRTASARAQTDCSLVPVDGLVFERVVRHDPTIALRIMRKLCGRLRGLEEQLRERGSRPVVEDSPTPHADVAVSSELPLPSRACLLSSSGQHFDLERDEMAVGRPDRSTGSIPDIDLSELDTDRTVSRQHARLLHRDGSFYVREAAASTNGTFVNGERVGHDEDRQLSPGDLVAFGRVLLRYETTTRSRD